LNGFNYGNNFAPYAKGIVCSPFTRYINDSNPQQLVQEQLAQVEMAIKGSKFVSGIYTSQIGNGSLIL